MAPQQVYPDISNDYSSESPRMSLAYINRVLDIITDNKDLRQMATGVFKQTGITAAGCAAGGLLMGPVGALIGGVSGALVAYRNSDDYENMITNFHKMPDHDKECLSLKVQQLVGADSIEEFISWFKTDANLTLLLEVLSKFARTKSAQ